MQLQRKKNFKKTKAIIFDIIKEIYKKKFIFLFFKFEKIQISLKHGQL
jgi:uncharacterized protein YbbC (DUF1343 family)